MSEKKVRITLEMTNSFVGLLNVNCQFKGLGSLRDDYKVHDPSSVLAIIALLEARGASKEQIYAETPLEWRDEIVPITSERRVYQNGKPVEVTGDERPLRSRRI